MPSGQLTPAEASTLLDHLIGDTAFRALFATDPVAALASIGISVDHRKCLDVDVLATPEELLLVRDELEAYLTSACTMPMTVVFCFEAGKVGEALS